MGETRAKNPMPRELDLEGRTAPQWSQALGYMGDNPARQTTDEANNARRNDVLQKAEIDLFQSENQRACHS